MSAVVSWLWDRLAAFDSSRPTEFCNDVRASRVAPAAVIVTVPLTVAAWRVASAPASVFVEDVALDDVVAIRELMADVTDRRLSTLTPPARPVFTCPSTTFAAIAAFSCDVDTPSEFVRTAFTEFCKVVKASRVGPAVETTRRPLVDAACSVARAAIRVPVCAVSFVAAAPVAAYVALMSVAIGPEMADRFSTLTPVPIPLWI